MVLIDRERTGARSRARTRHPLVLLVAVALMGALVGSVVLRLVTGDWASTPSVLFVVLACSVAAFVKERRR